MSTCKSCGAEIIWAITDKRRAMPVDAEPHQDGNVSLYRVHGKMRAVVHGPDRMASLFDDEYSGLDEYYRSHFVTCPEAEHHRRPG